MTALSAGVNGLYAGTQMGMAIDDQQHRFKKDDEMTALKNRELDINEKYHDALIDGAKLDNEIKRSTMAISQSKEGQDQLIKGALAYQTLIDGLRKGGEANAEKIAAAKQDYVNMLNGVLGPAINAGGPEHLDQKISDINLDKSGGLVMTLSNTDKNTGKTYEAPMTTDRKVDGQTPVTVSPQFMTDMTKKIFLSAAENDVDLRQVAYGMSGGQHYTEGENQYGVAGQTEDLSGKFTPYSNQGNSTAGRQESADAERLMGMRIAGNEDTARIRNNRPGTGKPQPSEFDEFQKEADKLTENYAKPASGYGPKMSNADYVKTYMQLARNHGISPDDPRLKIPSVELDDAEKSKIAESVDAERKQKIGGLFNRPANDVDELRGLWGSQASGTPDEITAAEKDRRIKARTEEIKRSAGIPTDQQVESNKKAAITFDSLTPAKQGAIRAMQARIKAIEASGKSVDARAAMQMQDVLKTKYGFTDSEIGSLFQ